MSSDTKMVTLNLKAPLLTPVGDDMKDSSGIDRAKLAAYTTDDHKKLPPFTIGTGLIALINGKKNCKDLEEMGKMSRLITTLRTKLDVNVGKWKISKEELLELETVFKTAPIAELNIQVHGQIYEKIQDLLRQSV